ncbi:MAG: thiamine pyrophosphate-binding protein [Gammaproteobacteria bacterium]|nr:thiamine pyrophosphate-binding protein [Gammaproteobacteria bacterium]MDH3537480.1 thiamine pyrophosphate-binding protein [Gammaproteobacteria bacterium]
MSTDNKSRSGAEVLIDALKINAVERIFCIPGESYLAALDALYDRSEIELIVCRNEGGAAYMTEADAKLTGRPGVCFVTRAPGATNASGGLHVAMQDSTPMILLIGQIARKDIDREAFQEIDYRRMFSQLCKWVAQIDDAARIPEYINRAFSVATAGRPGPVVLALPEDMLTDQTDAGDARPWLAVAISPAPDDVARAAGMLAAAERPLIIIGGSGWSDDTRLQLQRFAEANRIPVANSFRCQDYFDNEHPCYAGDLGLGVNPALTRRVREADCLLVIGARLGEMTTAGFSLIDIPCPRQRLIHVHPGAEELGHIYQPELAINAGSGRFVAALLAAEPKSSVNDRRGQQATQAHQEYLDWNRSISIAGALQFSDVIHDIRRLAPDDAIICNGAGNNTGWLHRFFRYRRYRTQLAPTSGTMGYGLPAAVAASLRYRERCVVALTGDGDFMMNGQELATAMQYRANIVVIVVNNGIYATIRMHQERAYPERVIGTDMVNPDFVALARAHGAQAELVINSDEFEAAFTRCLAADKPSLIEIRLDPDILTPSATVQSLRAAGRPVTHPAKN